MTQCWIVHQPQSGGQIVSDKNGHHYMFRTQEEAIAVFVGEGFFERGFVVELIHDAKGFRQATIVDGNNAVWWGSGFEH